MTEQQQGSQLPVTPRTVHVEGMVGEAETRCWLGSEHKGERGREEESGEGKVKFSLMGQVSSGVFSWEYLPREGGRILRKQKSLTRWK